MSATPPASVRDWDAKAERRVLWKVDLLLMPILTFSYGLQFYDKFVFSSAAVFGMLNDLHLTTPVPGTNLVSTQRYSTATAAFYWGYIVGVLPIALVLQRLPVAKALSLLIFIWGAIVMLTVTVSSYQGAVAQRFFLGLVESAVSLQLAPDLFCSARCGTPRLNCPFASASGIRRQVSSPSSAV
ncbi:hypothetical protein PsYK624_062770 [Phanerochaete sordida]|uniref:MFS general substrate transporter n=1 Tax=Phanerochaete sordida TaxID=48140 RepID=A0A9P3G8S2_9APHY|nr:hypothetical protein PsYK624_062770 [Phanerochaete sordida]